MNSRDTLKIVAEAIVQQTNSKGSPEEKPEIEKLLQNSDEADIYRVSGMSIGSFYSYSAKNLEGSKEAIWNALLAGLAGDPTTPTPPPPAPPIESDTTLGQLALYLMHKVNG